MANLSNINNILRTSSLGVGINCDAEFSLDIEKASANAILSLNSNGGFGAEYLLSSTTSGEFVLNKRYVGDRLTISSGGDATFAGDLTTTAGYLQLGAVALPSAGVAAITNRSSDNSLYIQTSSGNTAYLLDGSQNTMYSAASTAHNFYISNVPKLTIDSNGDSTFAGNVKIGSSTTGTPSTNANDLVIDKGASESGITLMSTAAASIRFGDAANTSIGSLEYNHNSNYMRMIVNNEERVRIDSDGNVGIGTSTIPTYWSGYTALQLGVDNSIFSNTATGSGSAIFIGQNLYNDGSNYKYTGASSNEGSLIDMRSGSITFLNAPAGTGTATVTPRLTIDSSGNVTVNDGGLFLNKSDGAYMSLKHNNSLKGYLGIANQVITGGSTGDIGLTATNNLVFGSGGTTERMHISSTGLTTIKRTGITGVAKNDMILQIGYEGNNGQNNLIGFGYNGGTNIPAYIGYTTTSGGGSTQGDLVFATRGATTDTAPTERMRITSGGDFGFNETTITNPYSQTPFTDLNIDGTWGGVISFKLGGTEKGWIGQRSSGNGGMVLGASSGQDLLFYTNGTNERMRIESGGNVRVNFNQSGSTGNLYFQDIDNGASMFYIQPAVYKGTAPYNTNYINAANSSNIGFIAGGSEIMRITRLGPVLIGKTDTNIDVGNGHRFDSDGAYYASIVNAENALYVRDITNSLYRFYVTGSGQINATSTSISAISDITLKENIKPLETGLNEVMNLKPRRFDWKNGDGENIAGFIAQEVEEVLPDLVGDYEYDDEETKKSLKMGDMIPTLVNAIQELKAEIEILKNK